MALGRGCPDATGRYDTPADWTHLPIYDAHIAFRYARNLAEGLGFVYNPGELVLGTTTPIWGLMLGVGSRLSNPDIPSLALLFATLVDT